MKNKSIEIYPSISLIFVDFVIDFSFIKFYNKIWKICYDAVKLKEIGPDLFPNIFYFSKNIIGAILYQLSKLLVILEPPQDRIIWESNAICQRSITW